MAEDKPREGDDPFVTYRAAFEKFDPDSWPQTFSAMTVAAVETEAEEAAAAAYQAVRRVAEVADQTAGCGAQESAEQASAEIQRVAFEIVRAAKGGVG